VYRARVDDMAPGPRGRGGGGGRPRRRAVAVADSDDDETDASRSDEDVFEDVRANDAFEDEEIDEDEAFNDEDDERYGDVFAGDDDDDVEFGDEDEFQAAEGGEGANEDDDDDDLNALMDSDADEEEERPVERPPRASAARRSTAADEDEDVRDLVSDGDDDSDEDDGRRARVLDDIVGERRGVRLDPRFRPVQNERVPENPMAIPMRLAEGEAPLTLKDVMASLGEGAVDKETAKRLAKIAKTKAADAPLARPIRERIDRKAAYAETSKDVSKYQAVVKENREKRTLKFEPARKEMQRKDTLGALVADFTPKSDLEKEIAKVLSDAGHASAKDVVRGEMVEMNHLDVEDVKERQAKLAKMRAVLFYHEQKAKRLKAIKSKAFHRHNRKGELKIVGDDADDEDFEDGEGDTPEERREYLRAQERMLLRHKNTSRWAKRAIKKGIAHLAGTREKLQEQLRIGQRLKEKIEGRRGSTSDDDDASTDAESDDDDDGDDAGDDPVAERKRRLKAKAAALKAIEEGEDAVDGANESLFKLPFMARAMEKRKSETRAEAQRLLDELDEMENDGSDSDSESDDGDGEEWAAMTARAKGATDGATTSAAKRARDDDTENVVAKSKKKKNSAPKPPKAKPIDEIPNAARRMREKAARRVAPPKVEEDEDEPVVMLDEERTLGATNEELMRRAFANDDIEAEFEKEKLADVDAELPNADVPKNLPGWGAWASEQRVPKWMQDAEKKAKAERTKALKNRRDAKLKHVVISEKFDKKAAQFNVESLPHGYASKATYEGSMRQPLGPDVNTVGMFSKLNAPKILKPTGSIIKPLKLPKQKQKSAGKSKSKSKGR